MAKRNSSTHYDRNMHEYKTRTSYSGTNNYSQQDRYKHNRVQVAHSNGCCSSKKSQNIPSQPVLIRQQQQQQPEHSPRHTAHEISHLRNDPPDPYYYQHGRVRQNFNRPRRPYQPLHNRNQIHATRPAPRQTNRHYQPVQTTTKKDGCCTIC